jgi:2-dehydropantoate 2-reductase
MQILVVGAGAVGGYFGGRLVQANRDVTFLVRAKRAEEIKEKGLQIISPHGNVTLNPKTATVGRIASPYDLILLSVKSYALSRALDDFSSAVGPDSVILPVLNGMRHMDRLVERFGERAVLGGVCMVATEVDQQGRIQQLADFQSLTYGELDGRTTPRLQELDDTLRGTGFDAALSTHILSDMWQKWVQLASVGAITCLMNGNIGEIASIPGGAALSIGSLRECVEVASACGYRPAAAFVEQLTMGLTAQDSQMTTSMYRDLKKGAPVEVDSILGDLVERGRKLGLTTPILQAALVNLSIYQRRLDRTEATST